MAILEALIPWVASHGRPFVLFTQTSVNLGHDPELIDLMTAGNFTKVFIGIESPDEHLLAATGKFHNIRNPLLESLDTITRKGLSIIASFIIGFDGEKKGAGERISRFVDQANIPVVMINLLYALPNTKLWERLKRESRLRDDTSDNRSVLLRQNFVPSRPEAELLSEYADTWDHLFDRSRFLDWASRHFLAMEPKRNVRAREEGRALPDEALPARATRMKELREHLGFLRVVWRQGIVARSRVQWWKQIALMRRKNPSRLIGYLKACVMAEDVFEVRKQIRREVDRILTGRKTAVPGNDGGTASDADTTP